MAELLYRSYLIKEIVSPVVEYQAITMEYVYHVSLSFLHSVCSPHASFPGAAYEQ